MDENYTGKHGKELRLPAKVGLNGGYVCADVPGHYNFRERIQNICDAEPLGVVVMVDSKDKNKLSEASEMLYDVLNNLNMLEKKTPILVACNKQDLQFSRRSTAISGDIEKEMEEIRKVRKAT